MGKNRSLLHALIADRTRNQSNEAALVLRVVVAVRAISGIVQVDDLAAGGNARRLPHQTPRLPPIFPRRLQYVIFSDEFPFSPTCFLHAIVLLWLDGLQHIGPDIYPSCHNLLHGPVSSQLARLVASAAGRAFPVGG
jgi:hypothetical protein